MSVALPLRHQKTTMGEKSEGHAGCLSFLIIFTGKRPTQQTQDSDLLKTKIFHWCWHEKQLKVWTTLYNNFSARALTYAKYFWYFFLVIFFHEICEFCTLCILLVNLLFYIIKFLFPILLKKFGIFLINRWVFSQQLPIFACKFTFCVIDWHFFVFVCCLKYCNFLGLFATFFPLIFSL